MFTLCNLIKTILPMHFQPETLIPAETRAAERGFSYSMPARVRSSARHLCSSAAAFIVVLGLVTSAVASPACAERPQDEIWLVSARQVGCLGSGDVPHLPTQRYDDQSGWKEADVAEIFQPSTPDQMLVIFIHGNRVESTQAACEGRYVYRLITSRIEDPVSIRFVIWSWPSAQIRGQLRDVRVKAERTEIGGYCLGWFLAQLPEEQRVSLLAYSYGVRIATGALHLLEGGQLSGRALASPDGRAFHVRLVMLAAALHNYWLRPGGYHDLAVSHIDYLLNLYNCCDPVLKRYPLLYKGSRADALGFTGMYTRDLGPTAELIEQHSFCRKSHAAIYYLQECQFRRRMQQVLLWRPVQAGDPVGEASSSVTLGN